jgi:hypothetical protein
MATQRLAETALSGNVGADLLNLMWRGLDKCRLNPDRPIGRNEGERGIGREGSKYGIEEFLKSNTSGWAASTYETELPPHKPARICFALPAMRSLWRWG